VSNAEMTDDKALVSRVIQGDRTAFHQLIQKHERLVAHMIARIVKDENDREEICQDVFLRIFEKISEFNFQSKLSTWIATIAYRQGINHLRKKRIHVADIPDERNFSAHFISESNPEMELADNEMEQLTMKMIQELPVQYKTVLTLYHIDGMNYEEMGEVTGMPEGTVKNYLFRARKLLKEKLSHYLGGEEKL
jgi:RNA polymerase sigma-70 factor (ECF subfamily)